MARDLSSVRDEVAGGGLSRLGDTVLNGIITDAHSWLVHRQLWPFRETDLTGTAGAGTASINTLGPVRDVVDTDNDDRRLVYRDRSDMVRRYGDLTTAGTPRYWYFSDPTTVAAYPVGGTIKVHHYQRYILPFTGDTDLFLVPDEWLQIVVMRARYLGCLRISDWEGARVLKEEIAGTDGTGGLLGDMVLDLLGQQVSDPDQIIIYGEGC